jgi:hypothetical protein
MPNRLAKLLSLPVSAIAHEAGLFLKGAGGRGERAVIETGESAFAVEPFAAAGLCTVRPKSDVHQQRLHYWSETQGVSSSRENVWLEVEWREQSFEVIHLTWSGSISNSSRTWIVARTQVLAEELFAAVCAFNSEVRDEVLVFEGGCWCKSEELFAGIQSATLDALILPPGVKEDLAADLTSFFGARSIYEEHGVPWKRGILLSGPPGNGKTLAIKALINHVKKPCLYVKSFEAPFSTAHASIRSVFRRARESAPCLLVFEDLDTLINEANKSYFLNELDGFAQNIGIVTLATTNHPEKLDPAIRDRPSRFDRTYPFALPGVAERIRYMQVWNASMKPALRLEDAQLEAVATAAEGFSYAYVKELFFSSMMKWISSGRGGAMKEIMLDQVRVLAAQMATASGAERAPVAGEPIDPLDQTIAKLARTLGR